MAKQKNNAATGVSFADAIASTLPDFDALESAYASPAAVPGAKTVPVADPSNPYAVSYERLEYTIHHDVFVIHRLYEKCPRCVAKIRDNPAVLPADDGDYVCPHTRRKEYLAQRQRFLSDGHIRQSEREETLMDGSIQVSLAWLVPRPDPKKKSEAKKRAEVHTSEDTD